MKEINKIFIHLKKLFKFFYILNFIYCLIKICRNQFENQVRYNDKEEKQQGNVDKSFSHFRASVSEHFLKGQF